MEDIYSMIKKKLPVVIPFNALNSFSQFFFVSCRVARAAEEKNPNDGLVTARNPVPQFDTTAP